MVIKRYMRKYDTCVGCETHISKLLLKKPPGILSTDNVLSVCEQSLDKEIFYKQLFSKKV